MKEVIINERFKVEIDKWNHTLLEWVEAKPIVVGRKTGQMTVAKWVLVGYYPNLKSAIKYLAENYALEDKVYTLEEYMNSVYDKAEELLNGIKYD